MPKQSNIIVVEKRNSDCYTVGPSPSQFIRKKFALFLKALPECGWDKEKAYASVGLIPGQVHRWIKKYPELKARLELCEEGTKDYAEKRIVEFMKMDNKVGMVATIFYLKTKCQDRGYVENMHISSTVENKYPKEMIDAVSNAARYGNSKPLINVTPDTKRLTSGDD